MFDPKLEIGQVINNEELCQIFKCSSQGGMRRSITTGTLVLIANYVNGIYHDRWIGGVLHYTGMGLNGDQDIDYSQNHTLNNAKLLGIDVFLFEVMEEREYTYCGRAELVDEPYTEMQLDASGRNRKVCIFPIKPIPDNNVVKPPHYVFADMEDFKKRGQNVDMEYADYRKKIKEHPLPKQIVIIPSVKPVKDATKILQEHDSLKGKYIKHSKYGEGIIKKIECNDNMEIVIGVKFDNETNGVIERAFKYKLCIENDWIELL